ncbi:type II toxin-antitoxin system RelE/ParE family toxin [Azospirillum sp. SYSU D00513]|uniref:type II toxin-antitoxin system RelE/ParE family toxin n=1 Tax=Azospirillum sp. SYSU D00513 TaxID=2812561 RepID=UPI001A978959|nr:type II toxin-antitoxin system RelE/ParE family toxin [Azospirillum sp. SYSU D00513]
MKVIEEYTRADGQSPFGRWFGDLDAGIAAKVVAATAKLQNGIGDVKPVGEGVSEFRIHWGPGYRVYFGQDGAKLVILLTGGDKSNQDSDIAQAKLYWDDYKRRKKAGESRTPTPRRKKT